MVAYKTRSFTQSLICVGVRVLQKIAQLERNIIEHSIYLSNFNNKVNLLKKYLAFQMPSTTLYSCNIQFVFYTCILF